MKQVNVFHADGEGGQWVVRAEGFETQEDAINWARPAAHHLKADLTIAGGDGRFREKDSGGNDPAEIPG